MLPAEVGSPVAGLCPMDINMKVWLGLFSCQVLVFLVAQAAGPAEEVDMISLVNIVP